MASCSYRSVNVDEVSRFRFKVIVRTRSSGGKRKNFRLKLILLGRPSRMSFEENDSSPAIFQLSCFLIRWGIWDPN